MKQQDQSPTPSVEVLKHLPVSRLDKKAVAFHDGPMKGVLYAQLAWFRTSTSLLNVTIYFFVDGAAAVQGGGVRRRKWGRWVSEIRRPNSRTRIWLGSYDTPEKAARAFDAASACLRDRRARLNFLRRCTSSAGLRARPLTVLQIQAAAARHAASASPSDGPRSESQVDDIDDHFPGFCVDSSRSTSPPLSGGAHLTSHAEDIDWSTFEPLPARDESRSSAPASRSPSAPVATRQKTHALSMCVSPLQ
ncbi:ethylene-responsive transcription factor ERF018-like [Zingiber officinale]|uniref:ethylene-responsive transcription factor ERF018-like n=1 Tax=Zingiber officinale TaxID=94328 RepID=UPI001C4CC620|nr:ethylene-responsive transcription factor ERF018-like [Zingiber officinale]